MGKRQFYSITVYILQCKEVALGKDFRGCLKLSFRLICNLKYEDDRVLTPGTTEFYQQVVCCSTEELLPLHFYLQDKNNVCNRKKAGDFGRRERT